MKRAALYLRISQDRHDDKLGVNRQKRLCLELAASKGWTVVADPFTDNDISATSGKRRPGFEALVQAIEGGQIEVVVAYHYDRIYRRLVDLEALVVLAERTGVTFATVAAGDIDLNTPTGRGNARILASVAQMEVERAGERIRAKSAEIASQGRPHGGGKRPLGYRYDKTDRNYHIIPDEAEVIRGIVTGLIEGRTMTSMVRELNELGRTTSTGNPWTTPTMAKLIRNPVIAGLRAYKGTTIPGTWGAIVTPDQQEVAIRILEANRRGGTWPRGTKPRYLLSGLMLCAHCGGKLYHSPGGGGTYFCSVAGGGKGCVRIKRGAVDGYVWMSAMVERPRPVRRKTLGSEQATKLAKERLQAIERRDELAQMLARGQIDKRGYAVGVRTIDADLVVLDANLDQLPIPHQGFRKLFGTDMTLEERREYLKSVTKSITVSKGTVTEERVMIEWV